MIEMLNMDESRFKERENSRTNCLYLGYKVLALRCICDVLYFMQRGGRIPPLSHFTQVSQSPEWASLFDLAA
jgi:hypothetical protein